MTITEPTTLATDYVLAALLAGWSARLLKAAGRRRAVRLWAVAFAVTALAAIIGGTYHGFHEVLPSVLVSTLFKVTLYTILVASWALLTAAIVAGFAGATRRMLLAVPAIKFAAFALWMISNDEFRYVIYDYAPALAAVLALQVYAWRKERSPAAWWIIGGITASFIAAGVQMSGFTLHQNFNHNDLYHVIQMVAFYLLYRGGLLLGEPA